MSEPRKTCVADALSLCGSWASCCYRCNTVLTDFQNSFTDTFSGKLAMMWSSKISSQLNSSIQWTVNYYIDFEIIIPRYFTSYSAAKRLRWRLCRYWAWPLLRFSVANSASSLQHCRCCCSISTRRTTAEQCDELNIVSRAAVERTHKTLVDGSHAQPLHATSTWVTDDTSHCSVSQRRPQSAERVKFYRPNDWRFRDDNNHLETIVTRSDWWCDKIMPRNNLYVQIWNSLVT